MADEWESDNGLDPSDGDDHATVMASGYTAIEEYVNELSDELVGQAPPEGTVTPSSTAGGSDGSGADDDTATTAGAVDTDGQAVAAAGDDDSNVVGTIALVLSVVAVGLAVAALVLVRRISSGSNSAG